MRITTKPYIPKQTTIESYCQEGGLKHYRHIVELSHLTKRGWVELIKISLKEDSLGKKYGPYVYQNGTLRDYSWESINFINVLRRVRASNRPRKRVDPFPKVQAFRFKIEHHFDLLKRKIRKPSGHVTEY